MKKIVLIAALLFGIGGASLMPVVAAPVPQVCDPSNPCVYTGLAKSSTTSRTLDIKVYMQNDSRLVATFTSGGKEYTVYVIFDGDGRTHINFNGEAYYFSI